MKCVKEYKSLYLFPPSYIEAEYQLMCCHHYSFYWPMYMLPLSILVRNAARNSVLRMLELADTIMTILVFYICTSEVS